VAAAIALLLLASACDRGTAPPKIGSPAPDFTVNDQQRSVSLSGLRGKTVVLNFWATWCPPCIEEMPSLMAMQRQLRDKGVVVLAVSTDEDADAYRNFLTKYNIDLLTVRDPRQASNTLYGTFKFPETYVIDSEGVMRRKFIGPVNWTTPEIMDYLTRLSPERRAAR